MQKIETERLELHKLAESDRDSFFELLSNSELLSYISDSPSYEEIESQFNSRIQPWNLQSQHWLTLAVFEKANGNFVGINGFKHYQGKASVGFIFLGQYQGCGYANESLAAVCEYAKNLGIKELVANITKGNKASTKLVEKCGFTLTNEIPESVEIGGKLHHDLEYKKVLS